MSGPGIPRRAVPRLHVYDGTGTGRRDRGMESGRAQKLAGEYLGAIPEEDFRGTEKKELQEELESRREFFTRAGLETDEYGNSPWIGILIKRASSPRFIVNASMSKSPFRYFCTSVYTALLYLVLDEDEVLPAPWEKGEDELADDWDEEEDGASASIQSLWHQSGDYIRLKKRFEEYGMDKTHLPEILYRAKVMAKKAQDANLSLHTPTESYLALKRFVMQGSHTVTGLYRELTGNPVYRRELLEVSGAFINPDLEPKTEALTEESEASVQYNKTQTDAIAQELYEKVVGQDEVIEQFRNAWFHKELKAGMDNKKRGP